MNAFDAANVTVGLAVCYFLSYFRYFFSSSLRVSKIENMKMQVGRNVVEWPKGAGAVMSPSKTMESSPVERTNEEDILFGHLKDQKEYLLQSFGDSGMEFSNPNSATMFPQGPPLSEGLGRHKGNPNPHVGLTISHPPVVAGTSYSSRARVPDGMQQPRGFPIHGNEDTLPKSRVGTGTYYPVRLRRHQSFEFHMLASLLLEWYIRTVDNKLTFTILSVHG